MLIIIKYDKKIEKSSEYSILSLRLELECGIDTGVGVELKGRGDLNLVEKGLIINIKFNHKSDRQYINLAKGLS